MKILEGKTIKKVVISDDKLVIKFLDQNNEEFIFATEGDCCNTVWIEHVNGIKLILGSIIHKVEEIPYREAGPDERSPEDDALDIFGYKLFGGGYCIIECRNSHNGYYGGIIGQVTKEYPGFYTSSFTEITDDF